MGLFLKGYSYFQETNFNYFMEKNQLNLQLGMDRITSSDLINSNVFNYYLFANYGIMNNINAGFKLIYCGDFSENVYGYKIFVILKHSTTFIGYEFLDSHAINSSEYDFWDYNFEYWTPNPHSYFIGYIPKIPKRKDMTFIFQMKLIAWDRNYYLNPSAYWEVYPIEKFGIYLDFNINFSFALMLGLGFTGTGGIIYKTCNFRVKVFYRNYHRDIIGIALEYRR